MRKTLLILAILTLYSVNAQIQISNLPTSTLFADQPMQLQEFNGKLFFSALSFDYGKELWSSDGTAANTNLVVDTQPGLADGLFRFYSTILNNELYFSANDENNYSGGELWKTDGTEAGSSLVTNYNGQLYGLTTVGNQFFFTIKTDDHNLQIWKSNGTSSGTVLVKDNIELWNYPTFQGSVNQTFIFTIQVLGSAYSKVWRSDGTNAGTYPVTEGLLGNFSGGYTNSFLDQYINYNNKLYFITIDSLYETDGTINGTNNVANVWNGQNQNNLVFGDAIELNGKMYFTFFSKILKKLSIYKSDGTSSGTSEIYTVTNSHYFYPSYSNKSGDNLIFSSVNSNNGTSLFYLDSNTNLVTEVIEIDRSPIEPYGFADYDILSLDKMTSNLFFVSSPKNSEPRKKGWILNIANPTLNPVEALDDIYPMDGQKIVYNNDLYYFKDFQLWKFDANLNINAFKDNLGYQVIPNPASEFIFLSTPDDISQMKIYDLNGKLVFAEDVFSNNRISIGNLNSGTYIIKILGKNGSITNKKLQKK